MQELAKTNFQKDKTPLRIDATSPLAWNVSHQFKTGFFVIVPSPIPIAKVTTVNMSTETSVISLRLAKRRQTLGCSGTKSSSHDLRGSESALGKVPVKGVRILFTAVQR